MIDKIIKEIFNTNTYTLKKLDKGLTNHNYLLCVNNEQYIVRIPRDDSTHLTNRKHEKIVIDIVKEIDVENIYFDEVSGIKITKYNKDVYEYNECPYPDKIERCAKLMKKLHQLEAVPFYFNPFKTLENYKNHVSQPIYNLSEYDNEIEKIKHFNHSYVLCHNDWVSGNILYTNTKDYLIDYEYAASNDPLFDVISFLSENKIFNKDERVRFYKTYFDEMTPQIHEQLILWEIFQNVLWCYWAMMMFESRKENIYLEIAKDKYDALKRMK